MNRKKMLLASLALTATVSLLVAGCNDNGESGGSPPSSTPTPTPSPSAQDTLATATPIKHLVIIYGENESFYHYFGTYPQSQNPAGEPTQSWVAPANMPYPNNYLQHPSLLNANP